MNLPGISSQVPVKTPPRARERLIVALDYPSADQALALAAQLQHSIQWFKIGLELYVSTGNRIVHELKRMGFSVFLDLKLHDIPNTVAGAVRSASNLGADLLTLHAAGGPAMLQAAAEAAAGMPHPPRLLAVTVLTSMDQQQLTAIGVLQSPAQQALALAEMAYTEGIPGLVCSAEEVQAMREMLPAALLVVPGIRPAGAAVGDQKRIATPATAIAAGASHLVVGRPITQASNPARAANAILEEINLAL